MISNKCKTQKTNYFYIWSALCENNDKEEKYNEDDYKLEYEYDTPFQSKNYESFIECQCQKKQYSENIKSENSISVISDYNTNFQTMKLKKENKFLNEKCNYLEKYIKDIKENFSKEIERINEQMNLEKSKLSHMKKHKDEMKQYYEKKINTITQRLNKEIENTKNIVEEKLIIEKTLQDNTENLKNALTTVEKLQTSLDLFNKTRSDQDCQTEIRSKFEISNDCRNLNSQNMKIFNEANELLLLNELFFVPQDCGSVTNFESDIK